MGNEIWERIKIKMKKLWSTNGTKTGSLLILANNNQHNSGCLFLNYFLHLSLVFFGGISSLERKKEGWALAKPCQQMEGLLFTAEENGFPTVSLWSFRIHCFDLRSFWPAGQAWPSPSDSNPPPSLPPFWYSNYKSRHLSLWLVRR